MKQKDKIDCRFACDGGCKDCTDQARTNLSMVEEESRLLLPNLNVTAGAASRHEHKPQLGRIFKVPCCVIYYIPPGLIASGYVLSLGAGSHPGCLASEEIPFEPLPG